MYYNQRYNDSYNQRYNDNLYTENDYYNDYTNNYNQNQYNKKPCCVKRVEETFCCYPSYYNEDKEEKKENCRNEHNCWEGYFKICPHKQKDWNNNNCDKNDYRKQDNNHCKKHNRCCGFCGLFRNW